MGQINVTGSVGAPPPPAPGDAETFTGTQIVYTPPSGGTEVTFNFASTVTWGRYWNGEPFVVSGGDTDIVITSISPASRAAYGRSDVDGAVIQPGDGGGKSFDIAQDFYDNAANVDPGNTGQNLTISASTYPTGATLIKGISLETTTTHKVMGEYVALTVVPSIPPANAFRPPVVGADKTSYYTTADVDMTLLKSVTPVTGQTAPSPGSAEGRTMQSWNNLNASARKVFPTSYHDGYAAYQRERYISWILSSHADYTLADKQKAIWTLVQNGLDYIASIDLEGYRWSDSAHNDDAKICAVFAAAMLGETSLRASNLTGSFAQDEFVYTVTQANVDAGDYSYVSATNFREGTGCFLDAAWIGRGFWISASKPDPNNDANYRWIHNNAASCEALGVLMIGTGEGKAAWENDAFFDLGAQIGFMQRENKDVGTRTLPDWQILFLETYQGTYYTADVLPEPPHSIGLSVSGSTVTVTLDGTNLYIGSGTYIRTEARWSTDRTNWTTVTLGAASGGTITGVTTGATVYVQARRVSSVGAGPWTTNHIVPKNATFASALQAAGKGTFTVNSTAYRDACDDTYEAVSGFEALAEAQVNGVIRT